MFWVQFKWGTLCSAVILMVHPGGVSGVRTPPLSDLMVLLIIVWMLPIPPSPSIINSCIWSVQIDFNVNLKCRFDKGRLLLGVEDTVYVTLLFSFFSYSQLWWILLWRIVCLLHQVKARRATNRNVSFNSVDNTKLPYYPVTLPPTQHLSFFRNLPPLTQD